MVSKLILGTVQFGLDYGINNSAGKIGRAEVKSILDLAYQNSIELLDTAEAYGDSQEVIGDYHKTSKNRFNVITKFSSSRSDLPFALKERISLNLKSLHVESLHCYMFHSYRDFKEYHPQYKNDLIDLKNSSIIKKLGVSVYTNEELEDVLNFDIDLVQLPFNLLDNKNHRSEVIEKAKQKGIEIHTRSAFLQGLFFKEIESLPTNLQKLKPYLNDIHKIASHNKISIRDLALSYVLQQNNIDYVLIGVDTSRQLEENINSASKTISQTTMKEVDLIDVEFKNLLNPSNWKN